MTTTICALSLGGTGLTGILISFLYIIIILAIIWGLLWCIENWISPIPPPVKLVLAIILLALIVIWAINALGGGHMP
jgi:hypothetical protein